MAALDRWLHYTETSIEQEAAFQPVVARVWAVTITVYRYANTTQTLLCQMGCLGPERCTSKGDLSSGVSNTIGSACALSVVIM